MTHPTWDRRSRRVDGVRDSIWTDGGAWVGLFLVASVLLAWAILSLPIDVAIRGMVLFFALIVAAAACGIGWLETMSSRPLPTLDHTPREARVREVREWDEPDSAAEAETNKILVDYDAADGRPHTAWLGDLIHETSIDRFAPESRWQVYAFADPVLADTMVVLTESHDDVWRSGSMVTGLHRDLEFSDLRQTRPGSPFLDGKRKFAP